jgi:hypothetical protein
VAALAAGAAGPSAVVGQVVDQSGEPIRNVIVSLVGVVFDEGGEGEWAVVGNARSDPQGEYRIDAEPADDYRVLFEGGTRYADQFYFGAQRFEDGRYVEVREKGDTPLARVALEAAGRIEGRVTDLGGNGIAGMDVTASHAWSGDGVDEFESFAVADATASTDPEGGYVITGLSPGEYAVGVAGSESWVGRTGNVDSPVAVGAGDTVELSNIALVGAGGLTGTVVDSWGEPVASMEVVVAPSDADEETPIVGEAETGQDGVFEVLGLAPGSYIVGFAGDDRNLSAYYPAAAGRQEAEPVAVGAGQLVDMGLAALAPASSIRGKAVDRAGQGVEGVEVSAQLLLGTDDEGYEVFQPVGLGVSGPDGAFTVPGLGQGTYILRFDAGEQWVSEYLGNEEFEEDTARLVVPAGQSVSAGQMTLTPAAWVVGRLVDDSGAGVEVATVSVLEYREYLADDADWDLVATGTTDEDGAYEVGGLLDRQYLVVFDIDPDLDDSDLEDSGSDGPQDAESTDGTVQSETPDRSEEPGSDSAPPPAADGGEESVEPGTETVGYVGVKPIRGEEVAIPDIVASRSNNGGTEIGEPSPEAFLGVTIPSGGFYDPVGIAVSSPSEGKVGSRMKAAKAKIAIKAGKRAVIEVRVTPHGATKGGKISAKVGSRIVAWGKVKSNGKATVIVPAKYLKKGTNTVRLKFVGVKAVRPSKTAAVTVVAK